MTSYESYTHTSAPWLMSIPTHWDCKKISELFSQRKVKVSDKEYDALSVAKAGIVPQLKSAVKTDNGDNRKLVCTGDFVINSRSDRKGSCGVSPTEGSVSLINIVLQPRREWNSSYVHFLLRSHLFSEEYYRNGRGIVADLWTTRYNEMKTIMLPVPPREEQDHIVRYLDWQVSRTNKLIYTLKKQIVLLKEQKQVIINEAVTKGLDPAAPMKDSGVDWIGEIPTSWKISRIGNHFTIRKRIAGIEGYNILSITQQGMKIKDISINEGQMAANYSGYQFVYPGDFAMNHMDLLTGYIDISGYFGVTSPDYRVFVLDDIDNCFSEYYLYLFQLCYKRRIFYGFGRGASNQGRWRLPAVSFRNFSIPLPTFEEQAQIVTYLNEQCAKIDALIKNINNEIAFLIEYRTRLISDVVTGQVDVRGVEIPEFEYVTDEADDASNDENIDTEETEDKEE